METHQITTDSVGRPLVGPNGTYDESPAEIRANFANLVERFGIDAPIVRAYSSFLHAEAVA